MIAGFFKQSKPIVFIILGIALTALFFGEAARMLQLAFSWVDLGVMVSKYALLMACFMLFDRCIKDFEIQKFHSFGALFFVLISSFFIPEILKSTMVFAFIFLTLGIMRLINLVKTEHSTLSIFEAVFFIFSASLFYAPAIYLLAIVLVAILIFTTPQWRHFIVPILAISAVVVLVEMYYLILYNVAVNYDFFLPKWDMSFDNFNEKNSVYLTSVWGLSFVLSMYQMFKVQQIRSLYHKKMAAFFMYFLILTFVSHWLTDSHLAGLWLLSLWPMGIYLADFVSRIKSRVWSEVTVWSFIILSIIFVFVYY